MRLPRGCTRPVTPVESRVLRARKERMQLHRRLVVRVTSMACLCERLREGGNKIQGEPLGFSTRAPFSHARRGNQLDFRNSSATRQQLIMHVFRNYLRINLNNENSTLLSLFITRQRVFTNLNAANRAIPFFSTRVYPLETRIYPRGVSWFRAKEIQEDSPAREAHRS